MHPGVIASSRLRSPAVIFLCLATVSTTGCVKQSTYDSVQAEIADARAVVASTKQDITQLAAQVNKLQDVNRLQEGLMSEALEALKKEQEAEALWQKQARGRIDSLVARLNALQQQRRWLERETESAVVAQRELDAKIAGLTSELDGRAAAPEPVVTPSTQDSSPTMTPSAATASIPPTPPQTILPPPEPPKTTPPPAVPTQKPVPQDESWFSTIKGWLGSVWRSIFS